MKYLNILAAILLIIIPNYLFAESIDKGASIEQNETAVIQCEGNACNNGLTEKDILISENKLIEDKCVTTGCNSDELKEYSKNISSLEKLTSSFGFGMAIGLENYKDNYISEAEIVGTDRTVRVTDSQKQKPSIWLETHYIWDGIASGWGRTHSAPGFYLGARVLGPESNAFEALSIGLLWSFKRTRLGNLAPEGQITESINIGIGPVWHKTRVLAAGIKEGSALPTDYNEIKYDTRDEVSWMFMVSAGF
jgi:hypothetical protein